MALFKKLNALSLGLGLFLLLLGISWYHYRSSTSDLQGTIGPEVVDFAGTIAEKIPKRDYESLLESLKHDYREVAGSSEYRNIQSVFIHYEDEWGLAREVKTYIQPDWDPNMVLYLVRSQNPFELKGRSIEDYMKAPLAGSTGAGFLDISFDDGRHLITAFAPVKGRQGQVLGLVEISHDVSEKYKPILFNLVRDIVLAMAVTFLFGALVHRFKGKGFSLQLQLRLPQIKRRVKPIRQEEYTGDVNSNLFAVGRLMRSNNRGEMQKRLRHAAVQIRAIKQRIDHAPTRDEIDYYRHIHAIRGSLDDLNIPHLTGMMVNVEQQLTDSESLKESSGSKKILNLLSQISECIEGVVQIVGRQAEDPQVKSSLVLKPDS